MKSRVIVVENEKENKRHENSTSTTNIYFPPTGNGQSQLESTGAKIRKKKRSVCTLELA